MHIITITRHPGWQELDKDPNTQRDTIPEAEKPQDPEPVQEDEEDIEKTENKSEEEETKRRRTPYDDYAYLYPDESETIRPIRFSKPTIFLSSRVHCGETPASFFLQGIYDFLMTH